MDDEYNLKPGNDIGSGKARAPENKPLSEIIEALNDLFDAKVNNDDQLQFLTGIAQRSLHHLAEGEILAQGQSVQLSTVYRIGITVCCRHAIARLLSARELEGITSGIYMRPKITLGLS